MNTSFFVIEAFFVIWLDIDMTLLDNCPSLNLILRYCTSHTKIFKRRRNLDKLLYLMKPFVNNRMPVQSQYNDSTKTTNEVQSILSEKVNRQLFCRYI